MPRYDYLCEDNGVILEVVHAIAAPVETWGVLCTLAATDPGNTPTDTRLRKIIRTPPMANTPMGDAAIKDTGFTKLVKRDDGVYENATRSGSDKRYVRSDDPAPCATSPASCPTSAGAGTTSHGHTQGNLLWL